jgi:hypothetical protein
MCKLIARARYRRGDMSVNAINLPHIFLGFCVLTFYWIPLLSRKGSPVHRLWGKAYFVLLAPILISVMPILLFGKGRMEPASFVQIVYLTICLGTVGFSGWRAIRQKADWGRFCDRTFGLLGFLTFAGGGALLAIGVGTGAGLAIVLSSIGLVYGGLMLHSYVMVAVPDPRWPLIWHTNSTAMLFSATHGSVSSVIWKSIFGPGEGDNVQIVAQALCLVLALALRLWIVRRFNLPVLAGALRSVPSASGLNRN